MLPRGKTVMQAVAQLVRQSQRVAQLAREVHQDIWVMVWCDRHAVGAPGLTRHERSVDPALGEELLYQIACTLREALIRSDHPLLGLFPREVARGLPVRAITRPAI